MVTIQASFSSQNLLFYIILVKVQNLPTFSFSASPSHKQIQTFKPP